MKLKAIDLFAGIGGIRQGFEDLGFKIVYSNDIDPHCAETYKANFDEIDTRTIEKVPMKEIPDFDVLLGGFPCQSFSIAGQRKGFADTTRGTLFFHIEKILAEKKPKAFLLENVGHLLHHDKGSTFKVIRSVLEDKLGYDVHAKILNAKDFGVPQNRPRIYIVGFKNKTDFKFPKPTGRVALKTILERKADTKYYISQKYYEGLERHRKRHESKGNGFGYCVLKPDGIANTLVLGGMGRERNLIADKPILVWGSGKDKLKYKNKLGLRKLTIRECARLQGIKEDFVFPVSNTQAYRQIANSVAVPVVRAIAKEMKKYL